MQISRTEGLGPQKQAAPYSGSNIDWQSYVPTVSTQNLSGPRLSGVSPSPDNWDESQAIAPKHQ